MIFRRFIKGAADRTIATAAILVLSPVMLALALAIRLRLGSPVLFRQVRIGLHDQEFVFFKFRSMTDERGRDGELLPDAQRSTDLGRFLRAASLDELPQLWNVVRGNMSLVGPRPLLPQYLPRYTTRQRRRHEAKPGITGWAQVHGRNGITWEQKFELDVWYVENWSLRLDLRIFGLTLLKVLRREGISQEGHATMPEFRG